MWLKNSSTLKKLLIDAINEEESGISEYRRLLDYIENEEDQLVILEIIEDERRHAEMLKEILNKL